ICPAFWGQTAAWPPRLIIPGDGPAAVVEDRLRAPILVPAGRGVAGRDRPLLAVGHRADPPRVHARPREKGFHRRGAAGAEREVIFARSPLVGMAFDGDRVLRILVEPAGLVAQDARRLAGQVRAVLLEMHDVADIDGEISFRPGSYRPLPTQAIFPCRILTRAGCQGKSNQEHARELAGVVDPTTPTHYWLLPLAKLKENRRREVLNDLLVPSKSGRMAGRLNGRGDETWA